MVRQNSRRKAGNGEARALEDHSARKERKDHSQDAQRENMACREKERREKRTFGGGGDLKPIKLVKNAIRVSGSRRPRTVVRGEDAAIIIPIISSNAETNLDEEERAQKRCRTKTEAN